MMNLLLHLVVFSVVNTGSSALEDIFKTTSYEDASQAVTDVDDMDYFNSFGDLYVPNKRKTIPHSPTHSSALSYPALSFNGEADPIIFNHPPDLWHDFTLNSHPTKRSRPSATETNELSSSNHDTTRPDTFPPQVNAQPSSIVSNIILNLCNDLHQDQISSQAGPRAPYDRNRQFTIKSLESIAHRPSSSNFVSEADASLIPNDTLVLPKRKIIPNWQNPSTPFTSVSSQETSVSDNQILSTEPNTGKTSTELALFSPEIRPCSESHINQRCRDFLALRSQLQWEEYPSDTEENVTQDLQKKQDLLLEENYENCKKRHFPLFDYIGKTYNVNIAKFHRNMIFPRTTHNFPAYLIFVDTINLIVPVDNMESAMQSACKYYGIVDQYLCKRKTEIMGPEFKSYMKLKVKNRTRISARSLMWCCLEVWLRYGRPSLFEKVKMPNKIGHVLPNFKAYVNHFFNLRIEGFTKEVPETSLRHIAQIHRDPIIESFSNLSERSPLKFDEKAFDLKNPEFHTMAVALEQVATFPNALTVQENNLSSLISGFSNKKNAIAKAERLNEPDSMPKKKNSSQDIRAEALQNIQDSYLQNCQIWLNYFDDKYKLELLDYWQGLSGIRMRQVFPLYVYFVDMINQIVIRGDPTTAGMATALHSFDELVTFYRDPKSAQENPQLWNSVVKTMTSKGGVAIQTTLWGFLSYWIKTRRPSLFNANSQKINTDALKKEFKTFFIDVFMLSCEKLTDKLMELNMEKLQVPRSPQ